MNENLVYQEIGKAVCHDAQADEKLEVKPIHFSKPHQKHGWDGENQEESIVLLKKAIGALVMVTM